MTEAQTALSRRVVACKGWRLMPGMLTDEGRRVMQVWPTPECPVADPCIEWTEDRAVALDRILAVERRRAAAMTSTTT